MPNDPGAGLDLPGGAWSTNAREQFARPARPAAQHAHLRRRDVTAAGSTSALKPQLDAALRKAAVVWVQPEGFPSRLVWALWPPRGAFAGSLLVVTGGTDQVVDGLVDGAAVTVVVARPGTRSRLVTVPTTATLVTPDEATAAALAAARRNAAPGWTAVHALPLLVG